MFPWFYTVAHKGHENFAPFSLFLIIFHTSAETFRVVKSQNFEFLQLKKFYKTFHSSTKSKNLLFLRESKFFIEFSSGVKYASREVCTGFSVR